MESIKKDFTSGIIYTSIAKYSGLIVQVLITTVLARLLTPDDFGVVAIATVLIHFFNTLSEAGIGPAIIQNKDLSDKDINSIFSFTIYFGVFLSVLFFLSSGLIASYYNNTELEIVCKWLSLLVLFSSLDIVPNSLLLKQKRFKLISIRTLSVQFITGVLSILAALCGWGLYSLVLSALSSKMLVFTVNYLTNPLKWKWSINGINKIKSYSLYQFVFNIINYLTRNLDKLIIGKFMGMEPLGYYEKSYRLMMLPLQNLTYVITPVLHPVFSNLQKDFKELLTKYLKLIRILACISFPLMFFLFFSARELILVFFGDQWDSAIIPFQILSLTAALQVIHATAGGVFQSINDTKGLFISGLISSFLIIMGFLISAIFGGTIESVAWSFMITCNISSVIVFYILFGKMSASLRDLAKSLKDGIIISLITFISLFILEILFKDTSIWFSLSTKSIAFFTIVLLFLHLKKMINIRGFYDKKYQIITI